MSKIYDIEEVIGNNQFTYQLYANIKPTIVGASDLDVAVGASGNTVFASFDVSGIVITPPFQTSYLLEFYNSSTFLYQALFTAPATFPDGTTIALDLASSGGFSSQDFNPNGSWEIRLLGTTFETYKDGILIASFAALGSLFADNFTNSHPANITNVVLGT